MTSTVEFEGFLEKMRHKNKSWTRAWCVALPGLFCYFKSATAREPSGQVALSECQVAAEGNILVLRTPARELRFRSPSGDVTSEWLSAFSRASALNSADVRHHTMHRTRGLTPVFCAACGKVLWGVGKTGYACLAPSCKKVVHLRCVDQLQPDCKGFAALSPLSPQQNASLKLQHTRKESVMRAAAESAAAEQLEVKRRVIMTEIGRLESELADAERSRAREQLDAVEHWASQAAQYTEELWRRELHEANMRHMRGAEELDEELRSRGFF